MSAIPLPPRPDPLTGEPRPPAAPLEVTAGTGTKHPERGPERFTDQIPPEGMGPVLEGYKRSSKTAYLGGATLLVMVLVVVSVIDVFTYGNPFEWARFWWLWTALVLLCFGYALLIRGNTVTCGADWVRKGSNQWVELYELREVKVTAPAGRFHLDLTDHAGRKIAFDLTGIQSTPYIWDYVYNGILHSVATGKATANNMAKGRLHLPPAP